MIPTLNEAESLRDLHAGIVRVCHESSIKYQIVFIDDGSTDESWSVIEQLVAEGRSTGALQLRRNFGKAAALAAGFEMASGEIVITLDADLQDDPNEIPRFLEQINSGLDVVSGWKKVRHDPWHKTFPSKVFNWLVSRLPGVVLHDHNCGFKAYRREIFDEIKLYGEHHRFVPVLAAARGWKIGEIDGEHHAREHGKSKDGASRLVKGFLGLLTIYFLTGYGGRPLHLIGSFGLLSFVVGALGLSYLSATWVLSRVIGGMTVVHLHEKAVFYYCILAILLGAQFLVAGLLAELIVSRSRHTTQPFSVAKRLDGNGFDLAFQQGAARD